MIHNNDFKYDLKFGQVKEQELANIFNNKTVEVKRCTGAIYNVFVEYECRGKKSGISTSQADYYCFAFKNTFALIETKALKIKCRKYINTDKDKLGGDRNKPNTKGILLPIKEIL